jgi:DNA mismatch repair protein MutL
VDVNVHPTKHEVRFREQGRVHDAIQGAVESVLKETPWLKRKLQGGGDPQGRVTLELPAARVEPMEPLEPAASGASAARVAKVRELLVDYQQQSQPPLRHYSQPPPMPQIQGAAACGSAPPDVSAVEAAAVKGGEAGYFSSLSVIGQFNASYILCQQGTDLVLIDQHAAHERVAFERLKAEFAGREVGSQGLLFPETMELSFRESAALLENIGELAGLGFALEEFGGKTWLLKGVPQILAGTEHLRIIRDILEELGSLSRSRTFSDVQEDILARIACHSVVRGRRTLTQQEIVALFSQMDRTDFSSNCPHGRPVMQRITLAEMEKMFKRG